MAIEIFVEDDFLDLAEMYVGAKKKEIPDYREALAKNDMKTIKDLSHKMKGTGASYGFDYLTEVGAAIEQASLIGDAVTVESLIDKFEEHINQIVIKVK